MAAIHFSFNATDRLRTACLIVERRHRTGELLTIYCSDPKQLDAFDKLLWEYESTAFVPHVRSDDPLAPRAPVVLSAQPPAPGTPWVLNLGHDGIANAGNYENIIEVVSENAADRERGRARWREYQRSGHTIIPHDAAKNQLP